MKESGNTLSQATKDRILRAVAVMQATVKTAKIQKLAQSTNLRDLSPDLLAWLGTTKDAEWQRGGTGRYLLVRDLDHDVWICQLGLITGYGKTFADAVLHCESARMVS